jgi:hypothetical protein
MSGAEARRYESGIEAFAKARANELQRLSAGDAAGLVSENMFDAFLDLVRYLRSNGIAVLVVMPPNERQWPFHAAFIAKLRRCCAATFRSPTSATRASGADLFVPASIRYDDEHMNAKGAAIWSRALADRAAEWMNDLH